MPGGARASPLHGHDDPPPRRRRDDASADRALDRRSARPAALVRRHGILEPISGTERLTPQDTERVLHEMLNDPNKLAEFEAENEVDFSFALEGLARFRVNAFRQKGFVSLVLRAIPVDIKSIEELSLPPVIRRLAEEERGIILLTGTTGSGKSTTLAAMIDH